MTPTEAYFHQILIYGSAIVKTRIVDDEPIHYLYHTDTDTWIELPPKPE